MKRLFSFIAATVLSLAASAQVQEIALTDTVRGEVKNLRIESGWQVRLIQSDIPTVTVVIPGDEVPSTVTILMNLNKRGWLNIRRNTSMPYGTVLEIACDFNKIGQIELGSNASVSADRLSLSNASVLVEEYADFNIRNLSAEECYISLSNHATVQIDSLSGKSLKVELNENVRFHYGQKQRETHLTIDEQAPQYETYITEGASQDSCSSCMLHDTILNITVFKFRTPKVSMKVTGGISAGIRTDVSNCSLGSPYYTPLSYYISVPIYADFDLNSDWKLRSGLYFEWGTKSLAHQVSVGSDGLSIADGNLPALQQTILNTYLGIPLGIYYTPKSGSGESTGIGFELRFAHILTSKMSTVTLTDGNTRWNNSVQYDKLDICNPWRIEAGISIYSNSLGLLHGCRIFTNLLPDYKSHTTGKGLHTFGVELMF